MVKIFNRHYNVMLAKEVNENNKTNILKSKDYLFEIKYDGARALIYYDKGKIKIINRQGKDISYRYPELNKIKLHCNNAIIDGEIVAFDKEGKISFALLQQREHLYSKFEIELKSKLIPIMFIAFDILFIDSKEIIDKPIERRKNVLNKIIEDSDLIRKSICSKDGLFVFKITKEQEMEGIIAKKIGSKYLEGKRSGDWIKIKHFKTKDCIVFFYTKGKGTRKDSFGALGLGLIKDKRLRFIGRVGSGFDKFMLKLIKKYYLNHTEKINIQKKSKINEFLKKYNLMLDNYKRFLDNNQGFEIIFIKPFVIEVKYLEFTDDYMLRSPVFLKIKDNKKIDGCVII